MNWKRALLAVVLLGFAFLLLVSATIGLAVTAVAATVVDSGLVEPVFDAVSEVAEGADRLRIEIDESEVVFTNLDNGQSRIIETELRSLDDRLEVAIPEVTITDPESGRIQILTPNLPERLPRIIFEADEHMVYLPNAYVGPAPFSFFFRGLTTLMALALVATGAWLLLRNRRAKEKAETL